MDRTPVIDEVWTGKGNPSCTAKILVVHDNDIVALVTGPRYKIKGELGIYNLDSFVNNYTPPKLPYQCPQPTLGYATVYADGTMGYIDISGSDQFASNRARDYGLPGYVQVEVKPIGDVIDA